MPNKTHNHRRVHNLLLLQRLLSLREGASPFTLIQDTIEQPAHPLIDSLIHNAKISKITTIYISFLTPTPPKDITHFLPAYRTPITALSSSINALLPPTTTATTAAAAATPPRTLLIIDTLHPLCSTPSLPLSSFLSSLITPTITLVGIYHTDIPLPLPTHAQDNPYAPSPLQTLHYLATTILTTHSLPQVLARKHATDHGRPEPVFGLDEGREGVLVGLAPKGLGQGSDREGYVLEMRHRRRSGREVEEVFVLPLSPTVGTGKGVEGGFGFGLLEEFPGYGQKGGGERGAREEQAGEDGTFELGLTEKQRRDREGVVLPYFDAQRRGGRGEEGEGGQGEGGRIVYEMGVEDDFDEEEDEI